MKYNNNSPYDIEDSFTGRSFTEKELAAVIRRKNLIQLCADFLNGKYNFEVLKKSFVVEDSVATSFDLNALVSASYPLATYDAFGVGMSMEEFFEAFPAAREIIEKGVTVSIKEFDDFMLNYKGPAGEGIITALEGKSNIEAIKFTSKEINAGFTDIKDYQGVKKIQLQKAQALEKRNLDNMTKNLEAIRSGEYFIIVNDSHSDNDECDNYIGNYYDSKSLSTPPYHYNCRCEIETVSQEEYEQNK